MASSGYLIIDDIVASLAEMSDLGRRVATASTEAIRDAVLAYVARRNWSVVRHQTFVDWVSEIVSREECAWLSLDPLFHVTDLGERIRSVRLTRQFDRNQTVVSRKYTYAGRTAPCDLAGISGGVGVIDDAVASGLTLRHVAGLVTASSAAVVRIVVLASSRQGHDIVRASLPAVRWTQFMMGDWSVVHLRDGCPHLPHSGRSTDQPSALGIDGTAVEIRIPSSTVNGNLWQVLCMDPNVNHAVAFARAEIATKLSGELGRVACVRDLCLLGSRIPALIAQGEVVDGDTTLTSLLDGGSRR